MSKLSFRARQVDYTKPLPIYLNSELPDLQDFAAINRAVPQMPTGMEKDEEAEHHLQRALSALQAFGGNAASTTDEYAIPTPKVEIDNKMYERIYNVECPKQKQYIRIQPFAGDAEYPDYDADWSDESWLKEERASSRLPVDFANDLVLFFETVMDRLEKAVGHSTHLICPDEAKLLLTSESNSENGEDSEAGLFGGGGSPTSRKATVNHKYKKERDEFVMRIYEYWKSKRLRLKHPLTPIVLTDKSGVVTQPNNPYLVFRRRTEKMQTRKNRKNEEQSYEKMLILKRDLCKAQQILKLINKRESLKKEFLKLNLETFEKRFKANDYDGTVCESIKCSLKPATLTTTTNGHLLIHLQQQQQLNNNTNKLNSLSKQQQQSTIYNKSNLIDPTAKLLTEKQKQKLNKQKKLSSLLGTNLSVINYTTHQQQQQKLGNLSDKLKQQLQHSMKLSNQLPANANKLTANNLLVNNKSLSQFPQKHSQQSMQKSLTSNSSSNKSRNDMKLQSSSSAAIDSPSNRLKKQRHSNQNESADAHHHHHHNNSTSLLNTSSSNLLNDTYDNEMDQQPSAAAAAAKAAVDMNEFHRRLCHKFNIDMNDLNVCTNYDEQLRLNDIENLEQMLTETRNKLSTSNEKDGHWCFKRKEGCKYLAQSGSIFKNDPFDFYENTTALSSSPSPPPSPTPTTTNTSQHEETESSSQTNKRYKPSKSLYSAAAAASSSMFHANAKIKTRFRDLQFYYYGYAITKHNRHLGLVRRRMGRGGRILFDKISPHLIDLAGHNTVDSNADTTTSHKSSATAAAAYGMKFSALSKFKTFYPKDCFEVNEPPSSLSLSSGSSLSNALVPVMNNEKKLKLKKLCSSKDATDELRFMSDTSDNETSVDIDNDNGNGNGNGRRKDDNWEDDLDDEDEEE